MRDLQATFSGELSLFFSDGALRFWDLPFVFSESE
jgi:hypothetical protein